MFRFASTPWLMDPARQLINRAFERQQRGDTSWSTAYWDRLLLWLVKQTAFRHFTGGESLAECHTVAESALRDGVKLILDHSVEEREDPDAWKPNLEAKCQLLRDLREQMPGQVSFLPVKVTALASPAMLEEVTVWLQDGLDKQPGSLAPETESLMEACLTNLHVLCQTARETGIPVLLDAEQSYRQPALDYVAMRMMREHNVRGERPIIYNTYQMYLENALGRVHRDIAAAVEGEFTFAAKVVRGAYLVTETERAREEGYPVPLHPSKQATDEAYNAAIGAILRQIHADPDTAAVVVATHNRDSVLQAATTMDQLGLARDHPRIATAQIMGMCENITIALGQAHYNSHKLVLFGDFEEIFPWLLRRLEENQDMLSAMAGEQALLWAELRRRVGPG